MATTFSRIHIFLVDNQQEALDRIALAHSVGSPLYVFLESTWLVAKMTGYGWPYFEDGGALVEIRPTVRYLRTLVAPSEMTRG